MRQGFTTAILHQEITKADEARAKARAAQAEPLTNYPGQIRGQLTIPFPVEPITEIPTNFIDTTESK